MTRRRAGRGKTDGKQDQGTAQKEEARQAEIPDALLPRLALSEAAVTKLIKQAH